MIVRVRAASVVFALAACSGVLALVACDVPPPLVAHDTLPAAPAESAPTSASTSASASASEATAAEASASMPTTTPTTTLGAGSAAANGVTALVGDAARGEGIYGRCLACHSLDLDRTGPRHCGLLGRRAASVAGFTYSDAMKRSGIIWDETSLDRFLAAPAVVVPGTAMTWAGIPDEQERADLIAWLKQQSSGPACAGVR